jgi:hypothetical protein
MMEDLSLPGRFSKERERVMLMRLHNVIASLALLRGHPTGKFKKNSEAIDDGTLLLP